MRVLLSLLFSILISLNVLAQDYKIEGTITGSANKQVFLVGYEKGNQAIIDTTVTDQAGYFVFELSDTLSPGMYNIFSPPNVMYELVFNDENIKFISTGSTRDDKVDFVESEENKVYYDYIYTKSRNMYKINLLKPLMQDYPPDDPFYKTLVDQYNKLKTGIDSVVVANEKLHPDFLAVKYMKSDLPAIPPPGLTEKGELDWLRKHFLDNVDFSDTALINTSILASKAINYIQLFQTKDMNREQAIESMKPAIDTLLEKATLNGKVYGWLMDYLVKGFESVGFDELLIYLADNEAADNICEDKTRKEVANKLELAKKLAIGAKAPEIKAVDINGNEVDLYKIDADKTVLVFWASWCPHCVHEALPVLKKLYDENKGKFEVVAVSVDDDVNDVKNSVTDNGFKWIVIAEGKGWDGKIPLEYGIAATPMFFILDKDKKIIAKPKSVNVVKSYLGL